MALKMKKKQSGAAAVSTTHKTKGQVTAQKEENMDTPFSEVIQSHGGTVGMEASVTINLGDFESVRIGISLSEPFEAGKRDETFAEVKTWVEDTLSELRSDVG